MRGFCWLAMVVVHVVGLKILAPTDMKGDLRHSEATFGLPQYGGSLTGQIFYWPSNSLGCVPLDRKLIPEGQTGQTIIVLFDRGNCTFVQKVRDAENVAANAVVITNNVGGETLVTMSDDGTGDSVSIPSVFISKNSGDKLKQAVLDGTKVMVQLRWSVPHPDNHVEWELWTSSNDIAASEFTDEFVKPAVALGNTVTFTPHYAVIDGTWFHCDQPGLRCNNQCTNTGRYCSEDPEGNLQNGVDGKDVVQENLRQICLWQQVNTTGERDKWWEYVTAFTQNCSKHASTFNQLCSAQHMSLVGADPFKVQQCVDASGGSDAYGGKNFLLERELAFQRDSGVFILPSIRINTKNYKGSLNCPPPVNLATCPVLQAICAGFQAGAAPAPCKPDYCWGKVDPCGVCDGDGQTCLGCDGVPHSGKKLDPCGKCGGDGSVDQCGKCLPADSPHRDQSCAGCDGVPNSGQANDPCGVCGGDGSTDLCGLCLPKDSKMRDKTCADEVRVTMSITGIDKLAFIDKEPDFETAVFDLLQPDVSSAENVEVTDVIQNATALLVKVRLLTQPSKGDDVEQDLKKLIDNGAFNRELHTMHIDANASTTLNGARVTHGTWGGPGAGERVVYEDKSMGVGPIAGLAVAGLVVLALFGVGTHYYVQRREEKVRMDMRKLIEHYSLPNDGTSAGADAGMDMAGVSDGNIANPLRAAATAAAAMSSAPQGGATAGSEGAGNGYGAGVGAGAAAAAAPGAAIEMQAMIKAVKDSKAAKEADSDACPNIDFGSI